MWAESWRVLQNFWHLNLNPESRSQEPNLEPETLQIRGEKKTFKSVYTVPIV